MAMALAGCAGSTATTGGEALTLPEPNLSGNLSLEAVLASRQSVRSYTTEPLTTREVGQLLWAAQGVTRDWGGRTAPSAGALYPLEIYPVTSEGILHYVPEEHGLEPVSAADVRAALAAAALDQEAVANAPVVFVMAGATTRVEEKYGERAVRYVYLEAGHAAQNLLLQAVALNLGAVVIGAFSDEGVRDVLGLPPDHQPLYLIPVGHPKG